MKKELIAAAVIGMIVLLSSCGEMWEFETRDLQEAASMTMSRRVFPMMEGDSYRIPVLFEPDSISSTTVYWTSEEEEVASFRNDTLYAVSEGISRIIARTTVGELRDTCWVAVFPEMFTPSSDYPYDMVVYASVSIHGQTLTTDNADDYVIAAYAGNELRGVGQVMQSRGIDYLLLRVWGPYPSGEEIAIRCYYRGQARVEIFPEPLVFDGEMHGTLSQLYPLVLDEQAREFVPDIDTGENPDIEVPDTVHVVIIE